MLWIHNFPWNNIKQAIAPQMLSMRLRQETVFVDLKKKKEKKKLQMQ